MYNAPKPATKRTALKPVLAIALAALLAPLAALAGTLPTPQESAFWDQEVASGNLPKAAERLPDAPLVVNLEAKGRAFGVQGGALNNHGDPVERHPPDGGLWLRAAGRL